MPGMSQICLLTLFSLLIGPFASASVALPGDGPYYRVRSERTLYVFDESARESVEQISVYLNSIRAGYDSSFAWQLDESMDLILLSPRQQVANAYATFSPNLKSVWYPSGSGMLESMAESSWALALATHETAHLYQLNAKGSVPATLKKFLGNAVTMFPFFWPIYLHPNMFTPTFLLEGNAVFNESRANIGGRLHSGEARALVLAQIKAGHIDSSRLINNQFRFPYGQHPYLQGGYFQAHLAAKYGVDKTNEFFVKQGDHYLWPLILNKTFREHFGASYPQEVREYVRELEALANKQQVTPAPPLSEAAFVSPFNHDENKIFYLASDGLRRPRLESFDKKSRLLSYERRDLPLGKVFWIDGQAKSADSTQHDLHHIEYSLYGEGYAFDPAFRAQIVSDRRAGKTVALDAAHSWLEPRILLNGEPYDIGHSTPILDDEGSVYYFRQNGSERLLYKNRQLVTKFDGFYAKATEVGPDGAFYFIGSTDYGSTLYQYKDGVIARVLDSDRVVDARLVNEREFLVCEVTADGHQIKLAEVAYKSAVPATYSYGFATYHIVPKPADSAKAGQSERPYNSLAELRYSSMDLASFYDGAFGLGVSLAASFADPLQYQNLLLAYSGNQFRSEDVLLRYSFSKYLPEFFTSYLFSRERLPQAGGVRRWNYRQWAQAGVLLPVLRWRHWDASLSLAASYRQRDQQETYGADSGVFIHYEENSSPALGMFPLRGFDLSYLNSLETLPSHITKEANTSLVQTQYRQGFPLEFYALLAGSVAWSEAHDVKVDYNPYALGDEIRISRIAAHDFYRVQTASSARLEINKVFNVRGYPTRFPVGLDRLAPLVVAQGMFFDTQGRGHGDYPANIFEWGVGADFQLLLFHLAHAKLRYLAGFDTRHPIKSKDDQVTFTLRHEF